MKKYFTILFLFAIGVIACKHQSEDKTKTAELILPPPPAEKSVAVHQFAPPVIVNEEAQGNENEAVTIDEPVGNADVKQVIEGNSTAIQKRIIKEGDIRFETSDVAETRKQIISSLKRLGGYTEDDSETTDGSYGTKEYTLSVHISAKNFDSFLGTVSSTASKIDSRNIRIKDVTTQFIDTKTRLDNKLQLEKRYLNLLNRAGKMRDLLDIEEKLTQIRSDIESTQSQLNYMSKQVEYSSLTITFYTRQPEQVNTGNGFGYKLSHAMANGWDWLQDLFFSLIAHWPLLLTLTALGLVFKRWRSRRKLPKQA